MAFPGSRPPSEDMARALDPATSGRELVELAGRRDVLVKAAIAARTDCPLATMLSLGHETDVRILEALAGNPAIPDSLLAALADSKRPTVRDVARMRLGTVVAR